MGVNVYLYDKIPKGFFPQQDTGRLQGNVMGQQHISYQSLVEKAKWFEEQIRNDPDVETVTMVAGTSGGGFGGELGPDQRAAQTGGRSQIHFGPGDRPPAPPDVRACRARMLFLQNAQDVRIGGRQGNAQYQYTLQAPDFDSLALWGPKVLDKLSHVAGDCGRQLRPAEFRPVVQRGDRPRYRVAPGPDGAGGGLARSTTLSASARSR